MVIDVYRGDYHNNKSVFDVLDKFNREYRFTITVNINTLDD